MFKRSLLLRLQTRRQASYRRSLHRSVHAAHSTSTLLLADTSLYLQEDLASQTDVVGSADQAPVGVMGFFQRAAAGGQDRADAFALSDRASILHHLDQPAIIPHVAESENKKFTFEVRLHVNSIDNTACLRKAAAMLGLEQVWIAGWHCVLASCHCVHYAMLGLEQVCIAAWHCVLASCHCIHYATSA